MCMVSNVSGYGQQIWPNPKIWPPSWPPQPQIPAAPAPVIIPTVPPDYEAMKQWWDHFKKALDAAKEFDKATGQPDCVEPEKEEWMRQVEERLKKLEEAKP